MSNDTVSAGAYGVTANGKLVVGSYEMMPAYHKNGMWNALTKVNGAKMGVANAVSSDGKYIVGVMSLEASATESWPEVPMLWEYNEERGKYRRVTIDGQLPSVDAVGNIAEQRRFTDISADGSMILGCMSYSHPGDGCCWFVYNRVTEEYDYIGLNDITPYSHVDQASLNNAGTMVTGIVHYVPENYEEAEHDVTFSYDVVNKEFKIYMDASDLDVGAFSIDNQGHIFASRPAIDVRRWITTRVGNYWYDLDQILKQRYGMDFTATTGFEYTGIVVAVSDDGKTLACSAYKDENYVVTFSELPSEAATHINLLANNLLFPATGATLSEISTLQITFDRNVGIKKNAMAYIYDSEGKMVRSSLSITPKNAGSKKVYSIGFRKTVLAEGEEYRLVIPEGTFHVEGDETMPCNEISATYVGRAVRPVQPLSYSPSNGMTVSNISYNSPVTVTFDVPIQVANNAVGYLYQEGTENALCQLTLVATENNVTVHPSATRNFYKDINYTVVIPAGAITDQVGACPNEEIRLDYVGIYERPLAVPGSTLFEENFEDPANSLATFLLWDGDNNSPTDTPLGWGFEQTGTPWGFDLRGDSASTDYCAGSHSMYANGGQADDWMTTPQIYIPSGNYKLYWMSQSYKFSKADVLKVYVWENDEVLTALNSSAVNRIKNEGRLVYEGVELPGSSEENLAGDWVQHCVELNDYEGKNIYVAFLNDNIAQSAVFVDSIKIVYEGNYVLGNMTDEMVVKQSSVPVSGYVRVTASDKTYNTARAYFYNENKTVQDEIVVENLNLSKDGIYRFTFDKELPVRKGKVTDFTIGIELDGDRQESKCSVSNLSFLPHKNVVVEKFTGSSCMYCPLGVVAFENLEKSFPDNFIPIEIHTTAGGSDVYANDAYAGALGYTSAPSGRINRIDTIYAPICEDEAIYTFTSKSGNITFADIVSREVNVPAEADVLVSATYNADLQQINITSEVNFALDLESANYKVSYILLEDSLSGNQRNGCYAWNQPILGDWCNGGIYASAYVGGYIYKDVARAVLGSYDGNAGYIPTSVYAGDPIVSPSTWDASKVSYINFAHAKLVCLLINANTSRVVNSAVCHVDSDGLSGIEDVIVNEDEKDKNAPVYDLFGRRVFHPVKGNIYVKNGRKFVK